MNNVFQGLPRHVVNSSGPGKEGIRALLLTLPLIEAKEVSPVFFLPFSSKLRTIFPLAI